MDYLDELDLEFAEIDRLKKIQKEKESCVKQSESTCVYAHVDSTCEHKNFQAKMKIPNANDSYFSCLCDMACNQCNVSDEIARYRYRYRSWGSWLS